VILRVFVPNAQISMLNTTRLGIRIGDGVNNDDGAQGLVMGHKPLVMGQWAQPCPAGPLPPWQQACWAGLSPLQE